MALPQLQWKLIGLIVAFGAGTCILSVFAVSTGLIQMKEALKIYPESQVIIDRYSDRTLFYLFGSFTVSALLNLTVFFVVLRRLAGPIKRLRDYFKKLSLHPETKDQLVFRGGDYFHDLPPVINQAVRELRGQRDDAKNKKIRVLK